MTTHPSTDQASHGAHRAGRGVPLGVVLLAILAAQVIVVWAAYQFLHAF